MNDSMDEKLSEMREILRVIMNLEARQYLMDFIGDRVISEDAKDEITGFIEMTINESMMSIENEIDSIIDSSVWLENEIEQILLGHKVIDEDEYFHSAGAAEMIHGIDSTLWSAASDTNDLDSWSTEEPKEPYNPDNVWGENGW